MASDEEFCSDDDMLMMQEEQSPAVSSVTMSASEAMKMKCCIAYEQSLLQLAQLRPPQKCEECKEDIITVVQRKGTAVHLIWQCQHKHQNFAWSSQPKVNRIQLGDFVQSVAILLSGNSYKKVALMNRFMNVGVISRSSQYNIQSLYTVPVIGKVWEEMKSSVLAQRKEKDVIIMGDGRNDSPGHSAQYCTYTAMDYTDSTILDMQVVDKRQTGGKSPNMEALGFKNCLASLKRCIVVKEIVTDQHLTIASIMRQEEIKHSYDIWHVGKNLAKRINEIGKKKDCAALKKWSGDIKNHLWYCAKNCEQNEDKFLMLWRGLVHHVTNKHTWDYDRQQCGHGPLEERREKEWLLPNSTAHIKLTDVVLQPTLLKKIPYLANFRHTGPLETFNDLILMYASKRFSYSPPVYQARCQLAAIDWNNHLSLPFKFGRNGKHQFRKVWSTNGSRWTHVPLKQDKSYDYIPVLMERVLQMRLDERKPMSRKKELAEEDPRRICRTIAPKTASYTGEKVLVES